MQLHSSKKCWNCAEWVAGNPYHCPSCGEILNEAEKWRIDRERKAQEIKDEERRIFEARSPFMQVVYRVLHIFEVIYLAIMSFIAWVVAWIAG